MVGLEDTIVRLGAYCRDRQCAGFDPYDALNSEWFARTPLPKSRVARLVLTQSLKRSPVELYWSHIRCAGFAQPRLDGGHVGFEVRRFRWAATSISTSGR